MTYPNFGWIFSQIYQLVVVQKELQNLKRVSLMNKAQGEII